MAWSSTFILCVAHGSRCRVKPPASPVSQMHLAAMFARPRLLELPSPSICEGLRFRQGGGLGRWLTVENDGQLGLVSVRHLFRPVELAGATRRLRRLTGDETPYLSSSRVPNRHSRSASKLAPRLCRCGPLPTLRNGVYRLALAAIGSFPFRGRPCCALPTSAVLGGASAILPPLAHRRPFRQLSEVLGQRGCAGADRACHPVHRACACPTSSSSIPTHSVCPSFA